MDRRGFLQRLAPQTARLPAASAPARSPIPARFPPQTARFSIVRGASPFPASAEAKIYRRIGPAQSSANQRSFFQPRTLRRTSHFSVHHRPFPQPPPLRRDPLFPRAFPRRRRGSPLYAALPLSLPARRRRSTDASDQRNPPPLAAPPVVGKGFSDSGYSLSLACRWKRFQRFRVQP